MREEIITITNLVTNIDDDNYKVMTIHRHQKILKIISFKKIILHYMTCLYNMFFM